MAKLTIYKDTITDRNEKFEKLLVKTQDEMIDYVKSRLGNHGHVISGNGYVYHKGTFPVLLCAHMDTVHKEIPRTLVYANGTLSSTQGIGGDDRCGIYMIFKILKEYDCHVVFLEDEEVGCVGAKKFAKSWICKRLKDNENLKYIIEFDRKGNNHAVFYDCDNPEFDEFITHEFFKKEYGTCSDISYIAPELGVAAVNLSCGYYKEHNIEEWVNLSEMETVIEEAKKVLERTKELEKPFKYIKAKHSYYGYGRYNYGYGYDNWYDDYYGAYPGSGYNNYSQSSSKAIGKTTNNWESVYEIKYKGAENCIISKSIVALTKERAYYRFSEQNPHVCFADIISITER